jgi:hypothetical protein
MSVKPLTPSYSIFTIFIRAHINYYFVNKLLFIRILYWCVFEQNLKNCFKRNWSLNVGEKSAFDHCKQNQETSCQCLNLRSTIFLKI